MIDYYINSKKARELSKKSNDNFVFGLCLSIIMITISTIVYITNTENKYDTICFITIIIGLLLLILSIVYPLAVSPIKKVFSFITNIIGKLISYIILTIIYFIFISTFGIIIRKKQGKDLSNSSLSDYNYNNDIININKNSFIYQISRLFKFFFNERYFMLIPVLIVLIILSIVLVLVQSSAIAPFIYTIF